MVLRTEFQRDENGIKMSQTRYIPKVLSKFKMEDCKPKPTPCVLGFGKFLNKDSSESTDRVRLYRAIVEV